MVEHRPVKAIVAGSSPASGAMIYKYHFLWYFMTFRDGFASIDLRTAEAVTNAFLDKYFSGELAEEEIVSPTAELEFPVIDVIMSTFEAKLEARKTGYTVDDELIEAQMDGAVMLLAILCELAEVENLDLPPTN